MKFIDLAQARYSVRSFADKQVEPEKLQRILEAGRVAPTAKNNQPQYIYVLQGETAAKAAEISPCTYNAPVVMIVCYDKDQVATLPEMNDVNFGYVDTAIVITHMMLQASALGLGSCWIGCFHDKQTRELFDIPDNLEIAALLDIGYPDEKGQPADRHTERKTLDETVKFI